MSDLVSLEAAQDHLRVDGDVGAEVLDPLIAAAEDAVAGEMGRPTLIGVGGWPDAASVPPAVIHAIKLVLGHLYEFRETTIAGSVNEVPIAGTTTLKMLLQRHTVVSFG